MELIATSLYFLVILSTAKNYDEVLMYYYQSQHAIIMIKNLNTNCIKESIAYINTSASKCRFISLLAIIKCKSDQLTKSRQI